MRNNQSQAGSRRGRNTGRDGEGRFMGGRNGNGRSSARPQYDDEDYEDEYGSGNNRNAGGRYHNAAEDDYEGDEDIGGRGGRRTENGSRRASQGRRDWEDDSYEDNGSPRSRGYRSSHGRDREEYDDEDRSFGCNRYDHDEDYEDEGRNGSRRNGRNENRSYRNEERGFSRGEGRLSVRNSERLRSAPRNRGFDDEDYGDQDGKSQHRRSTKRSGSSAKHNGSAKRNGSASSRSGKAASSRSTARKAKGSAARASAARSGSRSSASRSAR